ncbi:MAG TPA: NUDIX domain-containing protein [Phototrophicaceae bacterium]|nr:NUDIX domain-containing protein [Phototrophicaceae bacterium]
MPRRVEILRQEITYQKFFFTIEEARFRHELYNGEMSDELTRLSLERGDSAAVVLYDKVHKNVILTEQFRYPAYKKGPGWLLEIPAGTVEDDEDGHPDLTMRREIMEEIGYNVKTSLRKVMTFYVSPGGTSERIHLYYATATPKDRVGSGGGVLGEGEDIRVLAVQLNTALKYIAEGKIVDAKSIIGLQWLQLNVSQL